MLRSKSVIDAVVQLVGKIGCGPTASESVPFALDVQDLEPNERSGLALEVDVCEALPGSETARVQS
jgi:hypothetical protein